MNFIQKYVQFMDNHFPVGYILRHSPYILVFKTTNYCWYQCPHCCENSGPKNPRNFIPMETICDYLNQASNDPWFSREVVFTGGEIMSAYRFGPTDYVPQLLNHSLDLGLSTDIKTNAAWVRAEFGNKIFQDLHNVSSAHKPYAFQISLSLDKYHKNSVENNANLISRLAKIPNNPVIIHVSGFKDLDDMFKSLLERIKSNGLKADEIMYGNIDNMKRGIMVGDQILLHKSQGTLFDAGRAKDLENAYHTEFPQFKFMTGDGTSLIAFDSFGLVTLGENSGRKISTKWCNKTLSHVRSDLVGATWREEMRAKLFDGWKIGKNR